MNKKNKKNRGMSYVELIVVLGIFAVLSSVVMFNYGDFQARVDIKNLASDIALKIVEAQKSSINGVLPLSGYVSTWKPAYGAYFNSSSVLDIDSISLNKKFIYFVDLDNSYSYNGLPSCTTTECLDKIIITKNNYIFRIDKCTDTTCTSPTTINNFVVVFKRPDSGANFLTNPSLTFTGSEYIQITIKSPKGATALIKIYPSGRAQVN